MRAKWLSRWSRVVSARERELVGQELHFGPKIDLQVCSPLFFGFILIIPYEKTFHKKCITKKLPSYLRSPLYLFKSVHPALNCRPVRYLYS